MTTLLENVPTLPVSASGNGLYLVNRWLWTVDDFQRAYDLGLFGFDEKLELIEGEIIRKMPQGERHTLSLEATQDFLRQAFPEGFRLRIQLPMVFAPYGKPEPDLAIVAGSFRDYATKHPTTAVLVVEISDSTLPMDRTTKAGQYARAGIGEYWIVNIVDNVVEVHRDPVAREGQPLGYGYQTVTRHAGSDTIAPLAAPHAPIVVSALLP